MYVIDKIVSSSLEYGLIEDKVEIIIVRNNKIFYVYNIKPRESVSQHGTAVSAV